MFKMVFFSLALLLTAQLSAQSFTTDEAKLSQLSSSIKVEGNSAKLLIDGEESWNKRIELIKKARHHIHIMSLTLDNDSYGNLFKDILIDKSRAGLNVKFILDETSIKGNLFKGRFNKGRMNMVKAMREAGVDVILYNPTGVFAKLWTNTHEKVLIVDGVEAIVGGRNIGRKYYSYATDLETYMSGPIVHQVQKIFAKKWMIVTELEFKKFFTFTKKTLRTLLRMYPVRYKNRTSRNHSLIASHELKKMLIDPSEMISNLKKHLKAERRSSRIYVKKFKDKFIKKLNEHNWPIHVERRLDLRLFSKEGLPFFVDLKTQGVSPLRVIHHLPYEMGDDHLKDTYLYLINNAKKEIWIQNAYFFPTNKIISALKNAARRGVKVIVMTNSSQSIDEKAMKKFVRYPLSDLIEVKAEDPKIPMYIYELNRPKYMRRMLHGKSMVIDSTYSVVGSYNLDRKSENTSSEIAVLIYDKKLSEELRSFYEFEVKDYKEYTYEDYLEYRPKLLKLRNNETFVDYITQKFL